MADWDKPPWENTPFTGEPAWLRQKKRAEEHEWYILEREIELKLQGFPRDFQRMVLEALEHAKRSGEPPSKFAGSAMRTLEREFRDVSRPFTKQTPTYTQRPIEPLPEFFCLHFIGGPKSSTEEYWPYKKNANLIEQGKTFQIRMPSTLPVTITDDGTVTVPSAEQYSYKSTFIPRSETPFSDAQIVICLYQG